MSNMVDEAAKLTLTYLNPRRFALLMSAISLREPFAASDLREAAHAESSSLTRDLNALEASGLLVASPPAAARRQGQRVEYRVAADAALRFRRLAELVDDAWSTHRPPSGSSPCATGTDATRE